MALAQKKIVIIDKTKTIETDIDNKSGPLWRL